MKRLLRAYDHLIDGLALAAGLLIAAVCLLIVYDVCARNLGLQPPDSTVALTEYALLYFTMAAAPWLVRQRGHIVVEIVHARLSPDSRALANKLILGICIITALTVAVLAGLLALEAWQREEIEIRSLAMPRALLFAPLAVGFTLMTSEFVRLALRGEAVTDATSGQEAL
jgi:C4-dicarboxylate transporter DctQ subunit